MPAPASDEHQKSLNAPANEAWDKASQQTIEAFDELAPQIQVTNPYSPDGRVDPNEVADAQDLPRCDASGELIEGAQHQGFRLLRCRGRAKQELKDRLTKACQKRAPQAQGPTL